MTRAVLNLLGEHANVVRMLNAFERQLAIIEAAETPDYDVIRGSVEYCESFLDGYHHPKEEFILVKMRARDWKAAEVFGELEVEHIGLAALTRDLLDVLDGVAEGREIRRDALVFLGREFLELNRLHIRHEDEVFFPAVEKTLTADDWRGYSTRFKKSDPLFGNAAKQRFKALHDDILAWEQSEVG